MCEYRNSLFTSLHREGEGGRNFRELKEYPVIRSGYSPYGIGSQWLHLFTIRMNLFESMELPY